jgi:LytR cell envelope-related transcriptional attenuator
VDLVERVGAYVGLAAFLGLAILALLYFSQARDVRRLREWAGRAPERAADIAATQQHYLPPTSLEQAAQKQRKPLRERISRIHVPHARYVALVAGGLVIVAGAAFGALQLVGDDQDTTSPKGGQQRVRDGGNERKGGASPASVKVNPADVTVAVLNGTTIAGLAALVGEEARADGFTIGTVTNAARTDQDKSEVLYRNGQKNAAGAVARRLGIRSTAPVDPLSAELAGSFDVVVLVGADRAQ